MQAWPQALTHGLLTDLEKAINWYGDNLGLQFQTRDTGLVRIMV
jgi:hypothetical protein